jgi:hypothetical protein
MATSISPAEAEKIKRMLIEGLSYKEIHEITGRSDGFLRRNFSNFVRRNGPAPTVVTLGQKDVAYYTEDELLSLPPTYDYESLSEDEKKIFHGE